MKYLLMALFVPISSIVGIATSILIFNVLPTFINDSNVIGVLGGLVGSGTFVGCLAAAQKYAEDKGW